MLNYIWGGMMIVAIIIGACTGKIDAVTNAALEGAGSAVTMAISLCGVMCLWTGLMKVAERGGIIQIFSKALRPITHILFPKLKKDCAAMDAIVMSMVANLFGMASAATPLGLKAMKELDKLGGSTGRATNEMCMLVVMNTASLQLIPSTVIAIRQAAGSSAPTEIIVPVWIVSITALTVGVVAAKCMERNRTR